MGEAGLWGGPLECLWAGALAGEGAGLEQGLVDPTPCQAGEGGGGSSSGNGGEGAKHQTFIAQGPHEKAHAAGQPQILP